MVCINVTVGNNFLLDLIYIIDEMLESEELLETDFSL
jgi:hypothetical protein